MEDILKGNKRRYHIDSLVESNDLGNVYRAFSRHRSGQKIKRRYYAVFERNAIASVSDFDAALAASAMAMPYDVFEDERFEQDGRHFVVMAKGIPPREPNKRWAALQNHGYLMLILAALIFILMIVRFFQSPSDNTVANNEPVAETVQFEME